MGFRYGGDSTLGVSFTVQTPKPLDSRTVVLKKEDLYNIPEKYAYEGMTVACISDGNTYMLIDKNSIHESKGWKASYESIQILAVTLEEYDLLKSNTSENYSPIDPEKPYLYENTYYYIYLSEEEEEDALYYVTKKEIEDLVNSKADTTQVTTLSNTVDELIKTVADLQTQLTWKQ